MTRKKRKKPWRRAAAFFLLLAAVALAWFAFAAYRRLFSPFQGHGGRVVVVIDSGMPVSAIGKRLERHGIVASAAAFTRYYKLFHPTRKLKAGEYLFDAPLTMGQVIDKLAAGKSVLYRVTVKEGLWSGEIAKVLEDIGLFPAADFRRAVSDPALIRDLDPAASDLEGYLFPDTYLVSRGTSAPRMAAQMVSRFRQNFSNDFVWRARDIGFSVRQTVILASLIEKETANREERFLVSSVFHNRLRRNMLLDCDSTIIFALKKEGIWDGDLRWRDLKGDSPYNTRRQRGLPPGPIASPGHAALEAALYPENSDYLYFVAKDGNSHYFSSSLAEHNRAVRRFILQGGEGGGD